MKPQCTTAAECLRELARVIEQFGIENILFALNSKYVKYKKRGIWGEVPSFVDAEYWQFAIAEVEGKPVFIGDKLWHKGYGFITVEAGYEYLWELYSWNQPKPKTVTIELTLPTAKHCADWLREDTSVITDEIAHACKKALEELK